MEIRSDIIMPAQPAPRSHTRIVLDERTMAFHDRQERDFWKLHAAFWNERGNWPRQQVCLVMLENT